MTTTSIIPYRQHQPSFTVFECVEVEHEELGGALARLADVVERFLSLPEEVAIGSGYMTRGYRAEMRQALAEFREAGARPGECP